MGTGISILILLHVGMCICINYVHRKLFCCIDFWMIQVDWDSYAHKHPIWISTVLIFLLDDNEPITKFEFILYIEVIISQDLHNRSVEIYSILLLPVLF